MKSEHFQIHFEEHGCYLYKSNDVQDHKGSYKTWFVRREDDHGKMICVHIRSEGSIRDALIAKACKNLGIPVPDVCAYTVEHIDNLDDHLNSMQ
jgi:hypothetical protein